MQQILPTAITDKEDFKKLFAEKKLIPYAGTSALSNHSFGQFLADLSISSASRGACHEDMLSYAFDGGEIEVRYRNRSGFKLRGGREVETALAESYIDALEQIGYGGESLRRLSSDLQREVLTTGFGIQLGAFAQVEGARSVDIIVAGIEHVVLAISEEDELFAVYFPNGTKNIKESKEHYIYKVYANPEDAVEEIGENGEARIALICKNGKGYYGRPADISALREMITEASYAIHDEKVSTSVTTAKALIAYPLNVDDKVAENQTSGDDESPTALDDTKESIREARRNLDKNDLGYLPFSGEVPPRILNLEITRDAKHRTAIANRVEKAIYSSNKWSTDLTGASTPDGGIGAGYLKDLIGFKYATVIKKMQLKAAGAVNDMLRIAITDERFADVTHAFSDPLEGMGFLNTEDDQQ